MTAKLLWTPDEAHLATHPLTVFAETVAPESGGRRAGYEALHAWSIDNPGAFWSGVWDFGGVVGTKGGTAFVPGHDMLSARFFPEASLNFAENLLRPGAGGDAIVFRGEDKVEKRLSHAELKALVSRLAQAMRREGLVAGDRVAAMLPNVPEAVARCWRRPRSARSGRPARRISAFRACSTASARSSRRC